MMVLLLIAILVIGIILYGLYYWLSKRFVLPMGEVLYSDSDRVPGDVMHAKSIPLVGKPDYLIKKDKVVIPVEIKSSKTPSSPYRNHIAQLYAYCLIIEENYGSRPPYGIIRYPEKEFTLEFPENIEERLTEAVNEMLAKKKKGKKFSREAVTNICRSCRAHN